MSLFVYARSICGRCGAVTERDLAASVNADRRPDFRAQIIEGTFQAVSCAGCGASMRLPAHLSYLDVGRGQWILTEGITHLPEWRAAEAEARAIFDRSYGDCASPMAREIGGALTPRLVFGWPALREKLICGELELDDVTLELLKIAMLRTIADPPYADAHELRLTGGDADILRLSWIEAESEERLASVDIDRDTYDDIAGDPGGWSTLRMDLTGHLFVDLKRLIFA
jgi:CpXC protein